MTVSDILKCVISNSKRTECVWRPRSARTRWGSIQRSLDLLAGFNGRGRGREEKVIREGREREERKEEEEERGKGEKEEEGRREARGRERGRGMTRLPILLLQCWQRCKKNHRIELRWSHLFMALFVYRLQNLGSVFILGLTSAMLSSDTDTCQS